MDGNSLEHLYTLLNQYRENQHKLELRVAKYGLAVPLDLQNEIEYTSSKIEELGQEINRAQNKFPVAVPHLRFGTFLDWPPFVDYIKDAREIFLSGGSLDNLTQLFGQFLVKKAESGCKIRLILMDPESSAIPQVELWSDPDITPDYYRRAICRSLRRLAKIDKNRKLEIKLNPSIPALTVIILNGSQPEGKIRVDIQPFQAIVAERPVFELGRYGEDKRWYDLFYRQYSENLWSVAKPVDLSNLPPICLQFIDESDS